MASTGANNIVINAVDIYWRIEASEEIDFAGLTGADVKGKYFNISTAKDAVLNYVWGNDGVEADPAPAGRVAIPFTVVGDGDSDTTLASAAQVAIDGASGYTATVSGTVVTVKRDAVGEVTDTVDVDMGVSILQCRRGKDLDLGLLQGEPSPSFEPDNFDVTSMQTGVSILAKIFRGSSQTVETVIQETTKSKLREFYKIYGEAFTPGAGTEVYGVGTGQIGKNLLVDAARLEFVPVNSLGAELSYNYTMRLALPVPGSLVYSGENPRTLTVTWDGLPDLTATRANLDTIVVGDISQTGVL